MIYTQETAQRARDTAQSLLERMKRREEALRERGFLRLETTLRGYRVVRDEEAIQREMERDPEFAALMLETGCKTAPREGRTARVADSPKRKPARSLAELTSRTIRKSKAPASSEMTTEGKQGEKRKKQLTHLTPAERVRRNRKAKLLERWMSLDEEGKAHERRAMHPRSWVLLLEAFSPETRLEEMERRAVERPRYQQELAQGRRERKRAKYHSRRKAELLARGASGEEAEQAVSRKIAYLEQEKPLRADLSGLSPEERKEHRRRKQLEARRKRRKLLRESESDEERARRLARSREAARRYYYKHADRRRAEHNRRQRERYRQLRASMTPEEIDEYNRRQREKNRIKMEAMTPEELKQHRLKLLGYQLNYLKRKGLVADSENPNQQNSSN